MSKNHHTYEPMIEAQSLFSTKDSLHWPIWSRYRTWHPFDADCAFTFKSIQLKWSRQWGNFSDAAIHIVLPAEDSLYWPIWNRGRCWNPFGADCTFTFKSIRLPWSRQWGNFFDIQTLKPQNLLYWPNWRK